MSAPSTDPSVVPVPCWDERPEKPVLWGKLFAYKAQVTLAKAQAEAAARAEGRP